MTTINTSTNTLLGTNYGLLPYSQPQNSIINLFDAGFQNSGYNMQTLPQQQTVQKEEIPSVLNENPKNEASRIIGNYYAQAYQEYKLNEALAQEQESQQPAQQSVQQPAQQNIPQTAGTSAQIQAGPTMQDMFIANQLANSISNQFGNSSIYPIGKQGLTTGLLQSQPMGMNYCA